eukprot:532758_1
MSASIAMAATHSNSRSTTTARDATREGRTQSTYTYSKALLYSTQIIWEDVDQYKDEFITAIETLNTISSTSKSDIIQGTMLFIRSFGTHVLDLARMGARCRKTTFFSSSLSSEAHSIAGEQSASSSNSYSGTAGGKISADGVSVNAKASFSQSTTESHSSLYDTNQESSIETEYESQTLDCIGEVDVTSGCGYMLGTQDQPALVGYRMKPIWRLPVFINKTNAVNYIEEAINNVNNAGEECSIDKCYGIGVCSIDETFWTLSKYKNCTDESCYNLLWEATCFDRFQFGTSLMHSGWNVSNQMVQCNETVNIWWGNRYTSNSITYDPFCEADMDIVIGLNLLNLSVSFDTTISNINNNGFVITYGLLEVGQMEMYCTQVGGVSYAAFCIDNPYVTTITLPSIFVASSEDPEIYTYQIQIDDYISHDISCPFSQMNFVSFMSGYNAIYNVSADIIINTSNRSFSISQEIIDINTMDIRLNRGLLDRTWRVSGILHCVDENVIKTGRQLFNFTGHPQGKVHSSVLQRSWISLEEMHCDSAKVFVAISGFWESDHCSHSVWTEDVSAIGFNIVLGSWNTYGETNGRSWGNSAGCMGNWTQYVEVAYFAICERNNFF